MILDTILATKRTEVAARKAIRPLGDLERQLGSAPPPRDFAAALRRNPGGPIRLIAEFKRASPSKGVIRGDLSPLDVAHAYERSGASAMSVLTDTPYFQGRLEDLIAVRAAVSLPLIRKDFIVDRYQLVEARCAGADAALLIAAALPAAELTRLYRQARELGLAVLVEVHDEEDLGRALEAGPAIIGVNNRNLQTFAVDLATTLRLRDRIPEGAIVVSESGIQTREDVERLLDANVDAILVGETLMRRKNPGEAVRELIGA